jgi:GNAT superfamily N-acetyltransferase
MRIIVPDTDTLWDAYLACRYRNLYEPFGLPATVTTSELDSPRDRAGVLHRAVVLEPASSVPDGAGEAASQRVVAVGRLDLRLDASPVPAAQLRYFAADPEVRGTGVARTLLEHFEQQAITLGVRRLWMEARVVASGFYARAGYRDIGEGPLKHGIIPHRLMERTLDTL